MKIRFIVIDYHDSSVNDRVAFICTDQGRGEWAAIEGAMGVVGPSGLGTLPFPDHPNVQVRRLSLPALEPLSVDVDSYWMRAKPYDPSAS